jgi:hypothetical protein
VFKLYKPRLARADGAQGVERDEVVGDRHRGVGAAAVVAHADVREQPHHEPTRPSSFGSRSGGFLLLLILLTLPIRPPGDGYGGGAWVLTLATLATPATFGTTVASRGGGAFGRADKGVARHLGEREVPLVVAHPLHGVAVQS